MTCAELKTRLDAYARGVLPPAEAAALEFHLNSCSSCSAYLEQAESPPLGIASLPKSVEPEADLWPLIHGRIARGGSGARRGVKVPGWLLAAAAVALVAVSSAVTALLLKPGTPAPGLAGTAAVA